MDTTEKAQQGSRLAEALSADDSSIRLKAALAAGTQPDPELLNTLVERCAVEPDFYVRDMLSWALTRLPAESTLPRIRRELDSPRDQARSQALHTLSKIGDGRAWAWITRDTLRDADDEVARTAWRVAVVLAPEEERPELAEELADQLGRGDRQMQLSLSRALVDLGAVIEPVLTRASADQDQTVAAHARATELLLHDPEAGFDWAIHEARRIVSLGPDTAGSIAEGAGSEAAGSDGAGGAEAAGAGAPGVEAARVLEC
ncbi:HEAT repeat domain-containing protein [Streptomyces sp. XM4193]|uniref:HEAT repeat domain-containing protein n=1 Tax=Streptomyces sp. XM4193 TaxID=2929782 RepID=UPI001FFA9C29|nr:HEAT repeat domain-containing protein [Streptomyces sp. XM4193]MCK1795157.1 HEAT repeat domain-containing protein [Streptomyces sp. XM4193]